MTSCSRYIRSKAQLNCVASLQFGSDMQHSWSRDGHLNSIRSERLQMVDVFSAVKAHVLPDETAHDLVGMVPGGLADILLDNQIQAHRLFAPAMPRIVLVA